MILGLVSYHLLFLTVSTAGTGDSLAALEKLIVTERKVKDHVVLSIKDEEQSFGMIEDVDKLLLFKKGIDQVPEAGSYFLVHGNGIYDNCFVVNDIPLFIPSHFAGHTFADHNSISMASLKEITCYVNNAAGKYPDFSGGVFCLRPGILRTDAASRSVRPELLLNVSDNAMELFVSSPMGKNKDIYQIGAAIENQYQITWLTSASQQPFYKYCSALPFGQPDIFLNFNVHGQTTLNGVSLREYGYFSIDRYRKSIYDTETIRPWGIGSLSLQNNTNASPWKLTLGGSKQYYLEGKKYGWVSPIKIIERENYIITGTLSPWVYKDFAFEHEGRLERLDWNGTVRSFWDKKDSISQHPADSVSRSIARGDEYTASIATDCRSRYRDVTYCLKALTGVFFQGHSFFIDPGLTAQLPVVGCTLIGNAGIQTLRPDIRGLPDANYRKQLGKMYSTSIETQLGSTPLGNASIEGYANYKNRCPRFSLNPAFTAWDPGLESPLLNYGVNCTWWTTLWQKVSLTSVQNIGRSKRKEGSNWQPYEWEMPWSNKTVLRLGDSTSQFQCYITGVISAGLPYRELEVNNADLEFSHEQKRMPLYKNINLQFKSAQTIKGHRHLTRFEGFVEFQNLLNIFDGTTSTDPHWFWENTREYYWTDNLTKQPVTLEYFLITGGVRIGLQW
jgi:hypothetical protein